MNKYFNNINLDHITRNTFRSIHFVGIGGIGMSGIASVLHKLGHIISGSDLNDSQITDQLKAKGIKLTHSHDQKNINDTIDLVVITSALSSSNPEIIQAERLNIPVITRGQMLALLMQDRYGIAVSGTHGKTTTTAMLATIFKQAKKSPSYVVGGVIQAQAKTADLGEGNYLIVEADESDQSFLALAPKNVIITNIDYDHMYQYDHDLNKVNQCFISFANRLPASGLLAINIDCPKLAKLISHFSAPKLISFGLSNQADIQAVDCHYDALVSQFKVIDRIHQQTFEVTLNMPGEHNVINALGAIAVSLAHQIEIKKIQSALLDFQGVGRRFEVAEVANSSTRFTLINDYGHHPAEILATLRTIRLAYPGRRIVHLFQPHRYSRTSEHFDAFIEALSDADQSVVLKTYAASEKPIQGVDAEVLVATLLDQGKICCYVEDHIKAEALLKSSINDEDVVLIQGAGDVNQLVPRLKCW
ncbi:UDP-N-acetylmuramate--L-alanine ligase [Thiotrichales bacterium 19S3-7]|nr:UDP-N-acetylmuramate--L-alanine ligase [Thiotrichales bacterium 19S3-7]MCF6802879.1 UDP-N-acetylmuramate--L-alanine ligase [Thiotrichales bacterium 19S3-11]